jgi:hypothetical protein
MVFSYKVQEKQTYKLNSWLISLFFFKETKPQNHIKSE